MRNSTPPVSRLELRHISKYYPSVVANQDVSLSVMPGEIHAILGENGAGKSTLMKAVYGVIKPDEGQIYWNGAQVTINSPAQARKLGIGMVFQHFSLFDTLSVVENISLAMDAKQSLPALAARIEKVSQHYGLPLNPNRRVHDLSVGERQRVEIVRCLLQAPKLLIMDEPTSVLTPQAVRKLFETLRRLADEGCSILYISHKLDEIRELCHSATVLRMGKVTGTADPRQETAKSLAEMMIGKELPICDHPPASRLGDELLLINKLSRQAEDQFGYGEKAHLTAVTHHWESYYSQVVQATLDGKWQPGSVWGGIKDGMIGLAPLNKVIPEEVTANVEAAKAAIADGSLHPFAGPVVGQDGKEIIADGSHMSDEDLSKMGFYVKGVKGKLPD